jgi:hypothetical protein
LPALPALPTTPALPATPAPPPLVPANPALPASTPELEPPELQARAKISPNSEAKRFIVLQTNQKRR